MSEILYNQVHSAFVLGPYICNAEAMCLKVIRLVLNTVSVQRACIVDVLYIIFYCTEAVATIRLSPGVFPVKVQYLQSNSLTLLRMFVLLTISMTLNVQCLKSVPCACLTVSLKDVRFCSRHVPMCRNSHSERR